VSTHAIALLGAAAIGIILLQIWLLRMGARLDRRKRRRRARRAMHGEETARRFLKRSGYRVVDTQAPEEWRVHCGDEEWLIDLRADFLVERHGRRFVAEVKTGSENASVGHAQTRRQLLEYLLAYDVDGVLLVDIDAKHIDEVHFPDVQYASTHRRSICADANLSA